MQWISVVRLEDHFIQDDTQRKTHTKEHVQNNGKRFTWSGPMFKFDQQRCLSVSKPYPFANNLCHCMRACGSMSVCNCNFFFLCVCACVFLSKKTKRVILLNFPGVALGGGGWSVVHDDDHKEENNNDNDAMMVVRQKKKKKRFKKKMTQTSGCSGETQKKQQSKNG